MYFIHIHISQQYNEKCAQYINFINPPNSLVGDSMLRAKLILACLTTTGLGDYVPGNPGAAWSKEELLVTKAKLFKFFRRGMAPRIVRLGFHDCLKYADGTGGCDGCLNYQGVKVNHLPIEDFAKAKADIKSTDNNGLSWVVQELEKVYRDVSYPAGAPSLANSLFASGKSRADLWAFAAIVAVEYGMATTNIACDDMMDPRILKPSCIHDNGPDCKIKLARDFKFHSGRSDCTDHHWKFSYITTKKEKHPNPMANGPATVAFFKQYFGFTGRETAALMGAHTFGKLHPKFSIFKYEWTSRGIHLFNNDYYKGITGQPRWFIDDWHCRKVGDAFGNRPQSMWVAHSRKLTEGGGPIIWVHRNHACPSLYNPRPLGAFEQKCVDEAAPGMQCRADPPVGGGSQPRTADQADGDINTGCERFKAILVHDEIALNSDMGLYREFEEDNGVIYGCPGLEHINASMASDDQSFVYSRLPGQGLAQPLCQKQRHAEPVGSTPLFQIMEEYANNQTAWINEFIPAMEKMLRNGYSSLEPAPNFHTNIECPLHVPDSEILECVDSSPMFVLVNKLNDLTGKVYQYNLNDGIFDFGDRTNSANQLWQISEKGDQLINKATGNPLEVDGKTSWNIENQSNGDLIIVEPETSSVVDCWRARTPGQSCRLFTRNGNANQRFIRLDYNN